MTGFIHTSTNLYQKGTLNDTDINPNSRKGKVVNVLYRRHRYSVDSHIRKWGIRKAFGSIPIHSQDRSVATQPIAAYVNAKPEKGINRRWVGLT